MSKVGNFTFSQSRRLSLMVSSSLILFILQWVFPLTLFAATEFPDKLEFLQMLKGAKFEQLDHQVSTYQRAYEAESVHEREKLVRFSLSSFRSTDPTLEPLLNQWIEQMPSSYVARLARGRYYLHLGSSSRGVASARETSRARMTRMQGYFTKSVQDYRSALSLNSKLSVAYAALIQMAMVFGDRKRIDDFAQQAFKIDPYSFEVGSSVVFSLQPKWGGSLVAMKVFVRKMEKHVSKNPALAALRGYFFFTEADMRAIYGKRNEAIPFYNRAVQSGAHWRLIYARGRNYYYLGAYSKALTDFDHALELWPQHPWPLSLRAAIHTRAGNLTQAINDLNLALKLDPLNSEARWARAMALAKQGRAEGALEDIENALKFNEPDENIACAVVDVLDDFLELCKQGIHCTEGRQRWAGTIAKIGRSFTCPKMYLHWRHVWRIIRN